MYINKTLGHGSYIQKRLEREKPVCTSAVNSWLSRLQVLSISLVLSFPHFACIFFFIYFYQLDANYFTVLQWFLPYIDMSQP